MNDIKTFRVGGRGPIGPGIRDRHLRRAQVAKVCAQKGGG